jgi:hypothetical protein
VQEIFELHDTSKDIKNDYFEFQIIVVWSQDNVKFCKMSIMFNNSKVINHTSPTNQETLIHARKIWIEYKRLVGDIDER